MQMYLLTTAVKNKLLISLYLIVSILFVSQAGVSAKISVNTCDTDVSGRLILIKILIPNILTSNSLGYCENYCAKYELSFKQRGLILTETKYYYIQ